MARPYHACSHALETERLNACIGRELPGLRREIDRRFSRRATGEWATAASDLARVDATVEDTFVWLKRFIEQGIELPASAPYQGCADLMLRNGSPTNGCNRIARNCRS
jgi:hypothetical protein